MGSEQPLLYSYRRCPYAMRARMALLLAGRRFQVQEIVLRSKPAELLALSPKGTVPVLRLPDGRVIDESWSIMEWALAGSEAWRLAQSAENLALLACNDGPFKQQLDRCKYPERHPGLCIETERQQAAATLLLPLDERLRSQPQLGGATACATDLAIFPFIRQFAAVAPDWFAAQPWPALQTWLRGWLQSPLFAACMIKRAAPQPLDFPPLDTPSAEAPPGR